MPIMIRYPISFGAQYYWVPDNMGYPTWSRIVTTFGVRADLGAGIGVLSSKLQIF